MSILVAEILGTMLMILLGNGVVANVVYYVHQYNRYRCDPDIDMGSV